MFLDGALGALMVHLAGRAFDVPLQWWHIAFGMGIALLPDLDVVFRWLRHKELWMHAGNTEDHRDGLHYPLAYIMAGTALVFGFFGHLWAILFGTISLLHFVHDSFGVGWGVKWLWPFNNKNYKLFNEKDGSPSRRLIVSWTPEELKNIVVEHGDPDWIKNLFLRPLLRMVTFQALPPLGLAVGLLVEGFIPLAIISILALAYGFGL